MAKCIKCGEFAKFEGGPCLNCYKEQNSSSKKIEEVNEIDSNGLSEKDRNFRYGMIKGRIAEYSNSRGFFKSWL